MTRAGFTLLELMVSLLVAMLVVNAAWSGLHLLMMGDRAADRDAELALEEAKVLELLLRDLRSSIAVEPTGDGYRITRYTLVQGSLQQVRADWSLEPGPALVRRIGPRVTASFRFNLKLADVQRPFRLRLERVPGAQFLEEVVDGAARPKAD